MNKIWGVIIVGGLLYGAVTGRLEALSVTILNLPIEAFDLTLTLTMSACFWTGFMYILDAVGAVRVIARILHPILRRLFPNLKDQYALECISTNIAANVLGLGFAATPSGLKGIKRLKELSPMDDDTASDEMVTFLVLNTAGVTLLPTSVLAIRQQLGSQNPLDFVFLGILATICASISGLIADKIMRDRYYAKHH